jgi:hypothetical protein
MSRKNRSARVVLESIEHRILFSAFPLTISEVNVVGGTQLQITGSNGSEQIYIGQTVGGLVINDAGNGSQVVTGRFSSIKVVGGAGNDLIDISPSVKTDCLLYGGSGNNTLIAGSGNDSLWGGGGTDSLVAGNGNDTLVAVGDVGATLVGGRGFDSFWTNDQPSDVITHVTAAEIAGGNVHQITSFLESGATLAATTIDLLGHVITVYTPPTGTAAITDPATTLTYQSFSGDPLFSTAGPTADDIFQGTLGDCYFMAELSATAKTDPNRIRQSICDLGDGTYAVQLVNDSGADMWVRVDADLPTSGGKLIYGGLGAQDSLWVALMEKAYAAVASADDSYASINYGQTGQGFLAIGGTGVTSLGTFSDGQQLLSNISSDLLDGEAVSYSMGSHVYAVTGVDLDTQILTLRNPWGTYTTLTAVQAFQDFEGGASAIV